MVFSIELIGSKSLGELALYALELPVKSMDLIRALQVRRAWVSC